MPAQPTHPTDQAFLDRAERLPHGFAAVLRAGTVPSFTLAARETSVSARVTGDSGLVACVIASSRPRARATALLAACERDPAAFVPARETQGSFLLWDPTRRELLLGRDRTACYHLYAGWRDGALYVATGVEPFLGTVSTEFDPVGRDLFLAYSSPVAPFPIYRGIHPLLPGRYLRLDPAELLTEPDLRASRTFWRIEQTEVPGDYDAAVRRYGELFLDNVSDHLEGGTAGVMLSGGSDSACVVGALAHLGTPEVQAVHMRIEGHQDQEQALVEALRARFGFHLELVRPTDAAGDWLEHVRESIRWHVCGSYDTFPTYRLMGQRLAALLPAGSTVYNGEMCLLDQGFSDAADPRRDLKRWLYRGAGRRLARGPRLVPHALRKVGRALGQRESMPAAMAETALELLHAVGRPEYWYAGMKVGGRGFPGAPRAIYRFSQQQRGWDTPEAVVQGFFRDQAPGLSGPDWRAATATMANAWYSESSNFTMPLYALGQADLSLCFPFSGVGLMDFAASLPTAWAQDKRIQKDMSHRVLGLPEDVAYFQKDHSRAVNYAQIVYPPDVQRQILAAIAAHDYGAIQPGVTHRLEQLARGERQYSVVMFALYCLSLYADELG
ncbi:MAG: hypothetical protein H6744_02165 [Deltaproteobacteria bacterium]|nr:hypothetical protein [Deltaproteobacteria bacterium]